jgi:NAD-dependent dihydropyrimidine dehydrogenase PreA subunit
MSIEKIDSELCDGCGSCVDTCPVDCIRMDDDAKKAVVRYPEECMLCGWCVVICPKDAVSLSPAKSAPLTVSWG